jgi:hypothetical protein
VVIERCDRRAIKKGGHRRRKDESAVASAADGSGLDSDIAVALEAAWEGRSGV